MATATNPETGEVREGLDATLTGYYRGEGWTIAEDEQESVIFPVLHPDGGPEPDLAATRELLAAESGETVPEPEVETEVPVAQDSTGRGSGRGRGLGQDNENGDPHAES